MSGGSDAAAWQWLLRARGALANGGLHETPPAVDHAGTVMLELYLPLLKQAAQQRLVLGHLGQSLDGYIATENGRSHYITGAVDLDHKHRLRSLFDASLVGAATVRLDNPRLTTRRIDGDNPLRVVIDEKRSLGTDYHLFRDAAVATLVICDVARVGDGRHGSAEVAGLTPMADGGLDPVEVVELLAARGCKAVLVEGGGVTISRFLEAGVLDRLHLTVAPMVLGHGRAGLMMPGAGEIAGALRPQVRHFPLGDDMLFDCSFVPPVQ